MAAALVLAQLRAALDTPGRLVDPGLALLYTTDHYASHAQAILDHLGAALPEITDWVGTVGVGVCASGVEYFDEPAMVVMLCDWPAHQYRVFNGVSPLGAARGTDGFVPQTALVHADGRTPELAELVSEMAQRTAGAYLFGGLAASRGLAPQFARASQGSMAGQGGRGAAGVFEGGLSGVAWSPDVALVSRVTQGVRPLGRSREVTAAQDNVVLALDGEPALEVLLGDLGVTLAHPQEAVRRLRGTLAGVTLQQVAGHNQGGFVQVPGAYGADVLVRHLVGLDPGRQGVAVAEQVPVGARLSFGERHVQAARADLVRLCAEVREEVETRQVPMLGAVYVSCSGRGGPHFGGPSAELQVVRHALGDVPLVGFFAGGEIAHDRLHGYTGVLTVFTPPATAPLQTGF
ncbi:MAG: hypothetical protein RJA09_2230 [Pseudomonadota bacterium]|jgi:small ligand-binding sensory domain FIST